jgi:2-dehydro-3-deoxyphosphogluconate aldolase / (4S)-4-hydroxy-2-oxoglutarate aldolase
MRSQSIVEIIEETGVIAIIRRGTPFDATAIAEALVEGGVRVLEVTLNSHAALQGITRVREANIPGLVLGAGTVRTAEDAHAALAAGAQFLVAPNFNPAAVEVAQAAGVPMLPGVATPTEAVAAWQAGCQLLKFFPAVALGANYLKLMRDPLDDIKFVATGGVDAGNLADFVGAGAVAIGAGSSLVGKGGESASEISRRARDLLQAVMHARRA